MVVLHDWSLHHLVLHETVERGDTPSYLREMRRAHGETGTFVGRQVARALGATSCPRSSPERPPAGGEPGGGGPHAAPVAATARRAGCPAGRCSTCRHHLVAAPRPAALPRGSRAATLGLPAGRARPHRARPGHRRQAPRPGDARGGRAAPDAIPRLLLVVAGDVRPAPAARGLGGARPAWATALTRDRPPGPAGLRAPSLRRRRGAGPALPVPRRDVGGAGAGARAWAGRCSSPRAPPPPRSSPRGWWCPWTPGRTRRPSCGALLAPCSATPACASGSGAWPGSTCAGTTTWRTTATTSRGSCEEVAARKAGRAGALAADAAPRGRPCSATSLEEVRWGRPRPRPARRCPSACRPLVAGAPGAALRDRARALVGGDPGLQRGSGCLPRLPGCGLPGALGPRPTRCVVVDDGSTDGTAERARRGAGGHRACATAANRGKGHAVRTGMLRRGAQRRLMTDADLSTPIEDLPRLLGRPGRGYDVAIGSRALAGSRVEVRQPLVPRGHGPRCSTSACAPLALPGLRDTQCGFKLFTAAAARSRFPADPPRRVLASTWRRCTWRAGGATASPRCRSPGATTRPPAWPLKGGQAFLDLLRIRWHDWRGGYGGGGES